jgi:hypothetical protein
LHNLTYFAILCGNVTVFPPIFCFKKPLAEAQNTRRTMGAVFKRNQKLSFGSKKVTVTFFFRAKAETYVSAQKSDSHLFLPSETKNLRISAKK